MGKSKKQKLLESNDMIKECKGLLPGGMPDTDSRGINSIFCPQPNQPLYYTECCEGIELECCPASFLQRIDSNLVMIVALVVISSCAILIALILICCFLSPCPLYNVCRVNYTQGNVIAEAREDEPLTQIMPQDLSGQHHYAPNAVKIRPVEDV